MEPNYRITLNDLCHLMECHGRDSIDQVKSLGGVDGICEKLDTSPSDGLKESSTYHRRVIFGSNKSDQTINKPRIFLKFLWNALCDKIVILMFVYLILFFDLTVLLCLCIVVLTTARVDFFKALEFQNLIDPDIEKRKCDVITIRDCIKGKIPAEDLVVGDICEIKTDELILVDGILIQSNELKINEATINGSSSFTRKGIDFDVLLYSGTRVVEGSGTILVTAVGRNTREGIITCVPPPIATVNENCKSESRYTSESSQTITYQNRANRSILQQKVFTLTLQVLVVAAIVAATVFIYSTVDLLYQHSNNQIFQVSLLHTIIRIFLISFCVILYASPESAVLATVLSLALTIRKMTTNNILVRSLHSSETIGNITSICFDKTGILTTNNMKVVQLYICEQMWYSTQHISNSIPSNIVNFIAENVSVNSSYRSTIDYTSDKKCINHGNITECALLEFIQMFELDYKDLRNKFPEDLHTHVYAFNSNRKSMSTVVRLPHGGYRLLVKGASELILSKCDFMFAHNGHLRELTNESREKLFNDVINPIASAQLRTISLAYRDFVTSNSLKNETLITQKPDWDDESNIVSKLTLLCVLGIDNPIGSEVPETIKKLRDSGITVRMVTGDNVHTAKSVAVKCGIYDINDTNLVLESEEFNDRIRDGDGVIQQNLFDKVYPKLCVLARASPMDKYNLVKGIIDSKVRKNGEVVAMVGDGDGDALALRRADVGISLNGDNTIGAKHASSMILTDNKIGGICKAILWGRNAYDSVVKFVQYFLTVKLVFVICVSSDMIIIDEFYFVLLYFVSIFMIIFALVQAYFVCNPLNYLLLRKPHGRRSKLISKSMSKNILGQSAYQLVVLSLYKIYGINFSYLKSDYMILVYHTFILMILFNTFNSRKFNHEGNVFSGFRNSKILCSFIVMALLVYLILFFVVLVAVTALTDKHITGGEFLCSLFFGIGTLIWHQIFTSQCNKETLADPFSLVV